jgi:hypothetical protein
MLVKHQPKSKRQASGGLTHVIGIRERDGRNRYRQRTATRAGQLGSQSVSQPASRTGRRAGPPEEPTTSRDAHKKKTPALKAT